MASACPSPRRWYRATKGKSLPPPGGPTGDDRGAACRVTPCTPSHPGAEGANRPVLQWARETGSPVKGVKPMTAKEFYGTDWKTMDQARNQVLQAVRAGQRRPRRPGAVLYTTSRIKSPESACRKLRQRGLPATAQAAPDSDPRRGGGAGDLRLPGRCVPDGPVFGGAAGVCRPPDQGLHLPP